MESNNRASFACCRLPNSSEILVFQGQANSEFNLNEATEYLSFVASPYNDTENMFSIPFSHVANPINLQFPAELHCREKQYLDTPQIMYENMVAKAVQSMKNQEYSKIVLANHQNFPLSRFEPKTFFLALLNAFPAAFVSCFSSPQSGTWFGASPEKLLVRTETYLETVALAGTKSLDNKQQEWGDKEIQEQKWVEIYIEDILSKFTSKIYKTGPNTIQAGNLLHLCTQFKFEPANEGLDLNKLLTALNPTPAVAGLPKEKAIQEITQLEDFKRSFYSGFIGLSGLNQIQLFVNLRCMELHHNSATLFAGAGITKDSIPNKEWVETKNKMLTLEKHLVDFS